MTSHCSKSMVTDGRYILHVGGDADKTEIFDSKYPQAVSICVDVHGTGRVNKHHLGA